MNTARKFVAPWITGGLRRIERLAARAQGKGWGAASVRAEVDLALGILRHEPTLVVDVGGNVGDYAAAMLERAPSVELHVFEPSSVNVRRLRERFGSRPQVHVVAAALDESAGRRTLHSDVPGSSLASLSRRKLDHFGIDFSSVEDVRSVRFEDYWRDHLGERAIDILKIDIEGHELAALRGCGVALERVALLQFEFGGSNIDTRTHFQQFWYFFRDLDFQLPRMSPLGLVPLPSYSEADEFYTVTNYLAINRRG